MSFNFGAIQNYKQNITVGKESTRPKCIFESGHTIKFN